MSSRSDSVSTFRWRRKSCGVRSAGRGTRSDSTGVGRGGGSAGADVEADDTEADDAEIVSVCL